MGYVITMKSLIRTVNIRVNINVNIEHCWWTNFRFQGDSAMLDDGWNGNWNGEGKQNDFLSFI